MSSLTKLELLRVGITGDELSCLVSSSAALEQVLLRDCSKVDCLRIPCHLERLSHLKVLRCSELRLIESRAPNLSSFQFKGNLKVRVSLGEALQVKNLLVNSTELICYTRAELVSSTPSREVCSKTTVLFMGLHKLILVKCN
uniref:At1g61320/AtMIF1 LRR domain-containing protein n=1 Tax=Aegilops tauschii subsp. strangulata TaxID=200361 RepID=A0A453DIQ7_AEGTS